MSDKTAFSKRYIEIYSRNKIQNQNWINSNKLILNSSLAFNPQMREIARKCWILTKSQSGKAKSNI